MRSLEDVEYGGRLTYLDCGSTLVRLLADGVAVAVNDGACSRTWSADVLLSMFDGRHRCSNDASIGLSLSRFPNDPRRKGSHDHAVSLKRRRINVERRMNSAAHLKPCAMGK